MELKRLRNGVKRHFFPSGPQKSPFNFPPDDPDRHYEFKDTPVTWRPASPLIDRQKIPHDLESEIRIACAMLFHNIENGVVSPSVSVSRKPTTARKPRKPPTAKAVSAMAVGNDVKRSLSVRTDSLSAPTGTNPLDQVVEAPEEDVGSTTVVPEVHEEILVETMDEAAQESISESTVVDGSDTDSNANTTTLQPSNKTHVDIARSPPGDRSLADTERHLACSSQQPVAATDTTSVNGEEIPAVPALETVASPIEIASPPTPKHLSDSASEEDDVEVFLGEAGHLPCRTPSFSRPNDRLRSAQKKRLENPGFGPRKGKDNLRGLVVVEEGSSDSIGLSGSGTPHQHELDSRLSRPEWPNTDSEAAIVDTDGVLHVLTSEEETQRQLDLQRAVMEKMRTGTIGRTADQTIPATEIQRHVEHHRLSVNRSASKKTQSRVVQMSLCQEGHNNHQTGSSASPSIIHESQVQAAVTSTSSTSPILADPVISSGDRPPRSKSSGLMRKLSVLAIGRKKSVVVVDSSTCPSVTASG